MDGSRLSGRSSDVGPSTSTKRQRVEGLVRTQEQHEPHESTSCGQDPEEWLLPNKAMIYHEDIHSVFFSPPSDKAYQAQTSLTDQRSLKRPREESVSAIPSESPKQRREEDTATTGFGSGPAGKRHLLFTHQQELDLIEVHEPRGVAPIQSSIDHSSDSHHTKKSIDVKQQADLRQQYRAYDQASPSDLRRLFDQIERAPLTWKQRSESVEHLIQRYQTAEQGQAIMAKLHETYNQTKAVSEYERTWTKEQLKKLVEDMLKIKDFDSKTFQDFLSEESKSICKRLNIKDSHYKSLSNEEWRDIEIEIRNHNLSNKHKVYGYLFRRTKSQRNRKYEYDNALNAIARQQGFTSRYNLFRYHKKQRLNDASEPS
jgi:hypothetical protein